MPSNLDFLIFSYAVVAVIAGVKMIRCTNFFCRVVLEFFSGLASLERSSLAIRRV
jgi:hypothetical protein